MQKHEGPKYKQEHHQEHSHGAGEEAGGTVPPYRLLLKDFLTWAFAAGPPLATLPVPETAPSA